MTGPKKRTRWVAQQLRRAPLRKGAYIWHSLEYCGGTQVKVNKEVIPYLPTRRLLVILIKQMVDKKFRKEKAMARG